MKQNASSPQTLTKQELIGTLNDFRTATKQDIADAFKGFRDDITMEIKAEIKASETRMLTKMDEMEFRIEDRARERHSNGLMNGQESFRMQKKIGY